jgi:hypothetical protein
MTDSPRARLFLLVAGRVCEEGETAKVGLCTTGEAPIYFIPDSPTYSVPLSLKRRCDRTLRQGRPRHQRRPQRGGEPGPGPAVRPRPRALIHFIAFARCVTA